MPGSTARREPLLVDLGPICPEHCGGGLGGGDLEHVPHRRAGGLTAHRRTHAHAIHPREQPFERQSVSVSIFLERNPR